MENQNNIETRWDRIEKRHIHSAIVYEPSDAAVEICKNLIQNKEFVTSNQLTALMGKKSHKYCLDPNLIMDLRHSKVRHYCNIIYYNHNLNENSFTISYFFRFIHSIGKAVPQKCHIGNQTTNVCTSFFFRRTIARKRDFQIQTKTDKNPTQIK